MNRHERLLTLVTLILVWAMILLVVDMMKLSRRTATLEVEIKAMRAQIAH